MIFGVGIGEYSPREFTAFGIKPEERGRRLDEGIAIVRRLWTEPRVDFAGEFFRLEDAIMDPKPIRRPLPVWVGGNSDFALRRAARLADGWYSFRASPSRVAARMDTIRAHAREIGRDLSSFTLAQLIHCVLGESREAAWAPMFRHHETLSRTWGRIGPSLLAKFEEHATYGTPDDVAASLEQYRAAGVQHLNVLFVVPPDQVGRQMEWFAREVMPRLRPLL